MKKIITLSLIAATISTGVIFAAGRLNHNTTAQLAAPVNPEADDELTIYGSLENSDKWYENGGHTRKSGIYKFTVSDKPEFKACGDVVNETYLNYGGFYANGYFYYLRGDITTMMYSMTFNKVDVQTWKKVESSGHYAPTNTVAYDMTYDYTTSTAYAVCPKFTFTDSGQDITGYMLRTIDLDTGEFTDVAALQRHYTAVACDGNGQLWAIGLGEPYPHPAYLYKIDKKTGAETLVGAMGRNQKLQTSTATFDLRTGKLYWSVRTFTCNSYQEETLKDELLEVNTTDGSTTVVMNYPNSELFSSIFMIDTHPEAPEAVSDLEFVYKSGSFTEGSITMKLPTRTYSRKTLNGQLSVEVLVDGNHFTTATGLQPGATYTTANLTAEEGSHTITVICKNADGHASLKSNSVFHIGFDQCEGVSDVNVVTTKRGDKATITWKAPTKGVNGGYIDPSTISYRIRRRPENVEIASGLKTTTFTDTPDRAHGITQYEITAVANGVDGVSVNSEVVLAGQAHSIPYLETFDNNAAYMGFVTIDANNDGTDQGDKWFYDATYRNAIFWINYYYHRHADDWMITPTIDLKSDKVYRLQFDTYGHFAAGTTTFKLWAGEEPTLTGMRTPLHSVSFPSTSTARRINTLFTVEEGDCRIGFHVIHDGQDHITLDNIYLTEYGTLSIPQAPVVENVSKTDDGNVSITFTLPTKKVDGSDLTDTGTLYVYADNNRIVKKQPDPVKGSRITVIDKEPTSGVNNYVILLENRDGEGMEGYATINVVPSAPKPVVNAMVASTGNEAVISWEYPADMLSATGEKLRAKDITYNVYRTIDGSEVAIGTSNTSVTDDKAVMYLDGKIQGKVQYKIESVTEGGKAYGVLVDGVVGPSLDLPFLDDFSASSSMWTGQNIKPCTDYAYDPMVKAGVDDKYFLSFISSNAYAISPRLNLNSLINPQLSFWMYKTSNTKFNQASLTVSIIPIDEKGVPLSAINIPGAVFTNSTDNDGWVECKVDLSKYNQYTRASIRFACGGKGFPHIDKVSVTGERAKNDIRISSISGPIKCIAGRDNIYTVSVNNNGLEDANNFTVEFMIDGEVTETRTGSLASEESVNYEFILTPGLNQKEETKTISARVTSKEEDYNPVNNMAEMEINIYLPDLPYISTLRAMSTTEEVTLSWEEADTYPHAINVLDDVEKYENFAIDNISGWKMIDKDGAPTLSGISSSMGNYTWTNCGKPQAFIVFNPSKVGITSLATAYSGERCFVSFTSACGLNDDWLISPMLLGSKQTISFYARAMHPSYTNEILEIAVSASGTEIEDFYDSISRIRVSSTSWRKYEVELPAGTRYFAFHCLSENQFGLMIDNIDYVPAQPPVELWGYNVYRNGERIATEHAENTFTDRDGEFEKPYSYNVTAVYSQGESVYSNTVVSGRSGIDCVTEGDTNVKINPADGIVVIEGAEGQILTVHSVDGKLFYNFRATAIERLPLHPGFYVVRAGSKSAKIRIR